MTKMTHGRVPRGLVSVHADGGSQPDVKALVESLNKAVDNINADITRLQAAVDQANTQMAAFQMGGGSAGSSVADAEYTESFRAHFRKGEVQAALNKGAADEGGYLAPVEWDRSITDRLVIVSDMRQLANVQPCSGAGLTKLYNTGGTSSG
uniref:phage major capsid protein n=1 Tax=Pseudomonas aeruginosa TaxID=287 RepID=UPI003BF59D00